MHPDVSKLVEAGRITTEVGERLDQLSPGKFCYHRSWGAGKVLEMDLFGGEVVIDFEKMPQPQKMGLQLAMKKTEHLVEDDFRAQRVAKLDELREIAKEAPDEVVIKTLESHGGTLMIDQLERELCGTVIEEGEYRKWWDKAKKILREKGRVVVPTRRTEPMILRDGSMTPLQALNLDFDEARELPQKTRQLDLMKNEVEALAEEEGLFAELCGKVDEAVKGSLRLYYSAALDLLCCREELVDLLGSKCEAPEDRVKLAEVLKEGPKTMGGALNQLSAGRQRRLYEAFPEAFGDKEAKEKLLRLFNGAGTRGAGEIAKLFVEKGEEKLLCEHISKNLSKRLLAAEALVWLCRERKGVAKAGFSHEVGAAVLSALEKDHLEDGQRRSTKLHNLLMSDQSLVPDLLAEVDINEARNFARKVMQSPVFAELDRKSLMARIIKVFPETQDLVTGKENEEEREENLVVSWESLEQRKGEYEELVNKRIPQNIKDIAIARSYGDLRENFEYKSAKQMQAVLARRRIDMEKDLARAQGSDFSKADTSAVNIGTKVTLSQEKGEGVDYTILGAWDSIPEERVVSYLSNIGQALVGAKVGEVVTIKDLETEKEAAYKVEKIEEASHAGGVVKSGS